jgi:hypothetical protein
MQTTAARWAGSTGQVPQPDMDPKQIGTGDGSQSAVPPRQASGNTPKVSIETLEGVVKRLTFHSEVRNDVFACFLSKP